MEQQGTTELTQGELRALVASILGIELDDLKGYILIGARNDDAPPVLVHTCSNWWALAGQLSDIIGLVAVGEQHSCT